MTFSKILTAVTFCAIVVGFSAEQSFADKKDSKKSFNKKSSNNYKKNNNKNYNGNNKSNNYKYNGNNNSQYNKKNNNGYQYNGQKKFYNGSNSNRRNYNSNNWKQSYSKNWKTFTDKYRYYDRKQNKYFHYKKHNGKHYWWDNHKGYNYNNHVVRDRHGHAIGHYHHVNIGKNWGWIVPHYDRKHHATYYYNNGAYYYYPQTLSNDPTVYSAAKPETVEFGSFAHTADLAERLETTANEMCLDMYYNYKHNPGFAESYREAYQVFQVAKYIRSASAASANPQEMSEPLNGMDALLHNVAENAEGWTRNAQKPIGDSELGSKMEMVDATLHHLMNDMGIQPTAIASDGQEEAPAPDRIEEAPAPDSLGSPAPPAVNSPAPPAINDILGGGNANP